MVLALETWVHSAIEEVVVQTVDDVLKSSAELQSLGDDPVARLDDICFVLNRTKPSYLVSGRGLAHHGTDYAPSKQREADVAALVVEGVRRVRRTRRPSAEPSDRAQGDGEDAESPVQVPPVTDKLCSAKDLSSVHGVAIQLSDADGAVPMINDNWTNPYRISAATPGAFVFWPKARPGATHAAVLELERSVNDPAYEPLRLRFALRTLMATGDRKALELNSAHDVGTLYVSPKPREV